MKLIYTLAFLVTFALPCAAADDEYLEPLSPFSGGDWMMRVKEIIFGKGYYFGMVVSPSFKSYYGIDLTYEGSKDSEVGVITKYVTDLVGVYSEEQDQKTASGKYTVTKTKRRISKDLADKIFWITTGIVKKARYPESPNVGCDGATFMFSADRYSGRVWSPHRGEPAQLVSLWEALGKYASSKDAASDTQILSDIQKQVGELSHLLPVRTSEPMELPKLPEEDTRPNKAPVPTATSVTPAADAPVAPAAAAAQL